jgi:twitching motility protein PilT
MMLLETLIDALVRHDASDLHLKPGRPPVLRVHGQLIPLLEHKALTEADLTDVYAALTTKKQRATFEERHELDFGYTHGDRVRLRVNVARQRGELACTLRLLGKTVPTIDALQLPEVCKALALLPQGLVLITGPTGSGKSTTLAAMLEEINRRMARHIVTIEDPIEYQFEEKKCIFTQREVGEDTQSFQTALKHALRQDPDVIMVGEMRDLETIAATLTAAETGHLVLATLHTPSAPEAIDRIVDVFPAHQQAQIRAQLAMTLIGVIAQRLVARSDRPGRIAACEIMIGTPAVRNLIREGKTPQLRNAMQTGHDYGMQTLDEALRDLYRRQVISLEETTLHGNDERLLKRLKRT